MSPMNALSPFQWFLFGSIPFCSIPFFSWSTHAMRNYAHPDFALKAIASGSKDALAHHIWDEALAQRARR